MKKFATTLVLLLTLAGSMAAQMVTGQTFGSLPSAQSNGAVGPAGTTSSVSGLTIQVTAGPIFCRGGEESMSLTQLVLAPSTTNYVWFDCAADTTQAGLSYPNVPNTVLLATITTTASALNVTTDNRVAAQFPLWTDGWFTVPASACSVSQSGGTETVASVLKIVGNIQAIQEATTTTTATDTVICNIVLPSRLATSKGAVVNEVILKYGNSVGAIGTCNAPTVGTQTGPVPGTSETAAAAALVSAGGSLTVTPVVGSCNTAAITAGQMYSEKVALGTPVTLGTDQTALYLTQSFIGPAAASFTLNIAGLEVHYSVPMY